MMNMPTATYLKEEADDFLERVDDVNRQIRDLIDGKIDCDQLDKKEQEMLEKERLKQVQKEIQERERLEMLRKGRPGKGHLGGYKTFCKNCFREFTIDGIEKCS